MICFHQKMLSVLTLFSCVISFLLSLSELYFIGFLLESKCSEGASICSGARLLESTSMFAEEAGIPVFSGTGNVPDMSIMTSYASLLVSEAGDLDSFGISSNTSIISFTLHAELICMCKEI